MTLSMVDDILAVARCGNKSLAVNTYINSQIEMKRLRFHPPDKNGKSKCNGLHIGKKESYVPHPKGTWNYNGKHYYESRIKRYLILSLNVLCYYLLQIRRSRQWKVCEKGMSNGLVCNKDELPCLAWIEIIREFYTQQNVI